MRIRFSRAILVPALVALLTGCTAAGGPPKMSFWPFHKKDKPADALASAAPAPAFPVKPSAAAQPGTTAGAKAVASSSTGAAPASYPSTGPAVDYRDSHVSHPYAANAAGYTSTAPGSGASNYPSTAPAAQVGRYDVAGQDAPASYPTTRPAGYEQPAGAAASVAASASPYDSNPYDAPPPETAASSPSNRYATAPASADARYPNAGGDHALESASAAADRYDAAPVEDAAVNDPYPSSGSYETTTAAPPYANTQDERYSPGATGYQPGRTGYSPPGAAPYSSPAAPYTTPAAVATADTSADPHYRPGGTGDYVPGSLSRPQSSAPRTATAPTTRPAANGYPATTNPYAAPAGQYR